LIVTAIQINSNNNSNENLKKVCSLLEGALDTGPDIIVLPEYINYMGPLDTCSSHALPEKSIWHERLSRFAQQNRVGIIAGLLMKTKNNKASSAVLYVDKDGNPLEIYKKLHLFDINLDNHMTIRESDFLIPGTDPALITIGQVSCGFALCYDLRFPELFRRMTIKNARIIFLPAAFTNTTGKAHWEILVRARAIENQVFVVAVNQTGKYPAGNISYGMSMIVDPWGTILAKAPAYDESPGETIISANLNFSYQDKVRQNMPCLSHRREDLFHL
jgi:deaminated glutathione amidase